MFIDKLINMKSVARPVYCFRMASGEEIIAKLKDVEEDYIVLDKPRVVLMQGTPNGPALGLVHWFNLGEEITNVQITQIIAVTDVSAECEKQYTEAVSSIKLSG